MTPQSRAERAQRPTSSSPAIQPEQPRWAALLRTLRVASGLPQPVWAERMGVSRATVQRWESGELVPSAGAETALVQFAEQRGLFSHIEHEAALLRGLLAEARTREQPTRPTRLRDRPHIVPRYAAIPAPLTSFIGRTRELEELQRLLGSARLVTVLGTGGIGKTRLAFEVARAWQGRVAVADLTAVADPDLLLATLANAVDVREVPNQPLAVAVRERLREPRTLLVLDNCEHVRPACAELAVELLGACPEMVVLATSREPLAVPGEVLFRVPALSLPSPQADAASSDAVRLFLDRAAAHRPDLVLSDNMEAVAHICQRLDGLPLAIELAAARVRVLAPTQIAERIDDRLNLLSANNLAVAPRQRTLRAALDWSHDLLSDPERGLFRRLAVLAGPFELEAAEHVGAAQDLPREGVFDVLSALIDRSLLVADVQDGAARYRMLETVRSYALEHLRVAGEEDATRQALLGWAVALAQRAQAELRGPNQVAWLDRLDAAIEHVRAALAWGLEAGRSTSEREQAMSLAVAMGWFWYARGRSSEGRDWYTRCLAYEDDQPESLRARVLEAAATLAHQQSDYASASRMLDESLSIWRKLADSRGVQSSASLLGVIAKAQGELDRADVLLSEALDAARQAGDTRRVATILNNLASVAIDHEAYSKAEALFEESLALKRRLGEPAAIAATLLNMGDVALHRDALRRAGELLDESLRLFRGLGHQQGMAVALHNLGRVAVRQRDYVRAAEHFAESSTLFSEIEDRLGLALTGEGIAELAMARGEAERAAVLIGAASAWRAANGSPLPRNEQAQHAEMRAIAEARLGAAAFHAALATGAGLPLERALELHGQTGAEPPTDARQAQQIELTPREREVAALIADGLSNREIGSRLVITEGTAERHVANIMRKLGARSRAQIAAWVGGQRVS